MAAVHIVVVAVAERQVAVGRKMLHGTGTATAGDISVIRRCMAIEKIMLRTRFVPGVQWGHVVHRTLADVQRLGEV